MKKWLVGLLAAGLCVASAWAAGVATLPVAVNLTDGTTAWTSFDGFTGKSLGIYGDGRCKFDGNGDTLTVQFDAAPGTLSFDLKGNTATSGTSPAKFTVEASADGETWSELDDIDETKISASEYTSFSYDLESSIRYVRWTLVNKFGFNFGLNNLSITSGGPAGPSVSLKATATEVEVGAEVKITATATGFSGEVAWSWEGTGSAEGATFTLDTAVADTYEVTATATYEDEKASKSITVTVKAPAVKYAITVAEGIENGSIAADKDSAEEGETVTVTATPAAGYKLDKIYVNGTAIDGKSFPMPAEAVELSATFAEVTGVSYVLVESEEDFEEGAEYLVVSHKADTFTSALKNEANGTRIGLEEVVLGEDNTIVTDSDAIVWQIKAGSAEGQYVLFNEAASVYAAAPKSAGNNAQLVTDGSDALAQWTLDFSALPAVKILSVSYPDRYLQRNSSAGTLYFAAYASAQATPSLYKKAGASGPSVSLKASATEVEVGAEVTITATATGFSGEVAWSWEGTGSADGATFTLDTAVAGTYVVTATATAGEEKASKSITVTVKAPAVKYAITVAEGIENGSIAADKDSAEEGETVTVTATPAAGYKLDKIYVNGTAIDGKTFPMPAEAVELSATFAEVSGVSYVLVESEEDFEVGADYLVVAVNKDGKFTSALKNEPDSKGTRIGLQEVTISDNTIVTDDDSIVWTIQDGAAEGQYVLFNAAKSVYAAATKDDNVAQLLSEGKDSLEQWTLKFDGLPTVGIWNVAYPDRWLARNSTATSEFFAAYKGSQTAPYLFKKAGATGPSVSLKATATEVEIGAEVTITATAKNFSSEDVAWSWEGNGTADGATFTVDTSAKGEFVIKATATAGEETASATVTIKVNEPAVPHAITVSTDGNGTAVADAETAIAGTKVNLTINPNDGFKLGTITLNGTAISGTSFDMPDAEAVVAVTFVKVTGQPFTLITSVDALEDGAEYVITDNSQAYAMKAELSTGSTKRLLNGAVAPVDGVITTDDAALIWKLVKDADGNFALYNDSIAKYIGWSSGNSAKFQDEAFANTISYENELFVVMATSTAELEKPRKLQFNSATNSLQFAYYEGSQKNLCFFKGGAPKPSISYSGDLTVKIPGSFSIQFTLKNYDGEFTWVNDGREGGRIDQAGLYQWTPSEAGEVSITVKAMAGETEIATKTLPLVVEPKDEPGPGEPTLTCTEGTTINATVNKEVVLHFTLAKAEFFTGDGAEDLIGNKSELGEVSDVTATSFVWKYTPTEVGTVTLDFFAASEGFESFIIESYEVTLNVTEGGSGGDAVTVKGWTVNPDGSVTVTLSDGTTTSSGLQYSTDLKTWSTEPVDVKKAASAFVRVGSPE